MTNYPKDENDLSDDELLARWDQRQITGTPPPQPPSVTVGGFILFNPPSWVQVVYTAQTNITGETTVPTQYYSPLQVGVPTWEEARGSLTTAAVA